MTLQSEIDKYEQFKSSFKLDAIEDTAFILLSSKEFNLLKSKFERISTIIELLWGTYEFYEYSDKLILDSRNGTRQGFPADVATAILKLIVEHEKFMPRKSNWRL